MSKKRKRTEIERKEHAKDVEIATDILSYELIVGSKIERLQDEIKELQERKEELYNRLLDSIDMRKSDIALFKQIKERVERLKDDVEDSQERIAWRREQNWKAKGRQWNTATDRVCLVCQSCKCALPNDSCKCTFMNK